MKSPELPNEAGQHLEQAYSYKETCDFERVLRECDAAIQFDPSLSEAHNLRGIALEDIGRDDEAIKAYKQAISLNPDFPEAKSNLSLLELELGEKRQLITIATFTHPIEANIAKNLLDTEGIWSFVAEENINRLYPFLTGGIKIQVRQPDAERAFELLNEKPDGAKALEEELGKDEERQGHPSHQSPVVRYEKSNTRLPFFKKRK
jgi:tetratricopeptide (TPR) repeat protein